MTGAGRIALVTMLGLMGAMAGASVALAGGGCHYGATEGSGAEVEMIDACFTPTTLHAEAGQTITFVNRDPMTHNVTANEWGHFDDMNEGDRFTVSFDDEGVYPYACTFHPGMSGAIVIGNGDGTPAEGAESQPLAASTLPADDGNGGWLAAGAIGLLVGAAAGAGVATVRRRATAS
jgi:plastocyanin